jgi:hypothetical protein
MWNNREPLCSLAQGRLSLGLKNGFPQDGAIPAEIQIEPLSAIR